MKDREREKEKEREREREKERERVGQVCITVAPLRLALHLQQPVNTDQLPVQFSAKTSQRQAGRPTERERERERERETEIRREREKERERERGYNKERQKTGSLVPMTGIWKSSIPKALLAECVQTGEALGLPPSPTA